MHAELVTYHAGPGVGTLDDFTVQVRQPGEAWRPVAVYPMKVDEVRGTKHCAERASMAYFDFARIFIGTWTTLSSAECVFSVDFVYICRHKQRLFKNSLLIEST